MSKLMWILVRCMATALLGIVVLMAMSWGGAQARTQVLAPPMAAALVAVCSGRPCLAQLPQLPQELQIPAAPPQNKSRNKSRKRLTRRST